MRLKYLILAVLFGLLPLTLLPLAARAQTADPTPTPPAADIPKVHTVAEGENLVYIASLYSTTVEAIQVVNNIADPSYLYVGQTLIIPGATGGAVPTAYAVEVGDTLQTIAARFNTSAAEIASANNLVDPRRLYAGQRLLLISRTGTEEPRVVKGTPHIVQQGETLLTVAVRYGVAPLALAQTNALTYPVRLYPGQQLQVPSEAIYYGLPDGWVAVRMRPQPEQGKTTAVFVQHTLSGTPNGRVVSPEGSTYPLQFASYKDGYAAILGLDAFAPSGRYWLELGGEGLERPWLPFRQEFVVRGGDYVTQSITLGEEFEALLAPEVRAAEDAFLETFFSQFTPEKRWDGPFVYPVQDAVVTARYGDGRSYNEGPVEVFHTGIDFAGAEGTPILSAAPGTVVYTGTLQLRGNTVVIDHGWGVMSAYYHLSEIAVKVGDVITGAQQLVGFGGNTGLSTGPHLHWDMRVLNAAVDPVQWTQVTFPE